MNWKKKILVTQLLKENEVIVKVTDYSNSELVQKKLISMGYKWAGEDNTISIKDTYIHIYPGQTDIYHGSMDNDKLEIPYKDILGA